MVSITCVLPGRPKMGAMARVFTSTVHSESRRWRYPMKCAGATTGASADQGSLASSGLVKPKSRSESDGTKGGSATVLRESRGAARPIRPGDALAAC
jgi:hypothetical protein